MPDIVRLLYFCYSAIYWIGKYLMRNDALCQFRNYVNKDKQATPPIVCLDFDLMYFSIIVVESVFTVRLW